jgi:protein-tyrosine phosphatase
LIARRYGTFRGAVRLALSYLQVASGNADLNLPPPESVKRLVFVCHGNICRSAFADVVARDAGLHAASFGLSTSSGQPAHWPATVAASTLGVDLTAHRTTRVEEYEPLAGDLLLAMEVRQLRRLAADPRLHDVPRTLLGLWTQPRYPHLHDPYQLDNRYMRTCLTRVQQAVANLAKAYPGAKAS